MDLFEQYQKDWKEGKANPDSNPLSNLKNKEIMDQLIRYEQEEAKQIKKGLIGGGIGIVLGTVGGLTGMISGGVPITSTVILGVLLMFFSLFYAGYKMYTLEKEPFPNADHTTASYLKQAKERLIIRKGKIKKNYLIYVLLVMIGVGMVTSMLPYFAIAGIVACVLLYFFWDVKKDPSLIKQLAELDEKIANLK